MARCQPCQDGHHGECVHSLEQPCDCLVCIGGLVGERVLQTRQWHGRQDRESWEAVERDPEEK